jgi:hypothetical protein
MSLLAFLFVTFLLFLLPLLPAIFEFAYPTDNKPLRIVQEYDTDIRHFANGFRVYLQKQFGENFHQVLAEGVAFQEGNFADGAPFQVLGRDNAPEFSTGEKMSLSSQKVIISTAPLKLPARYSFDREIYSTEDITSGIEGHYRALLAEGNIVLDKSCTLLRWVHSAKALRVGRDCRLYGRASADETIQLAQGCEFERISAPRVIFGEEFSALITTWDKNTLQALKEPTNISFKYNNRWVIDGSITLPENSYFEGDIIATQDIVIGHGSFIKGSVKSNRNLTLESKVCIEGSAVSAGNITTGNGCTITRPVIAEEQIFIGSGNSIGLEVFPTTVTAPVVVVTTGTIVYGSVWALERALVSTPEGGAA